jgi:hypothetical protein
MKSEILSYLQIQESLLQSYRGIFLTSESILFAIAGNIITNENPKKCVLLLFCVLGLIACGFWWVIVKERGDFVTYFQKLLKDAEKGHSSKAILTKFENWKKNKREEKIQMKLKGLWEHFTKNFKHPWLIARKLMDVWLPIIFVILWFVMGYLAVWPYLKTALPDESCY